MRKGQRGFTLIEVLLSVVILSTGLIGVYRPLLSSLSSLNYVSKRAEVTRLIEQNIWDQQEYANRTGNLLMSSGRGDLMGAESAYNYMLKSTPLTDQNNLYEQQYKVSWTDVGRRKSLTRVSYVRVPTIE